MKTAIVHDSLTGDDPMRVVRGMVGAYPDAAVHSALQAGGPPTVAPTARNDRAPANRGAGHHLALPLLAPAFSTLRIDADVTLVSSTGWAHGVRTTGRKIVYCHSPARWSSEQVIRSSGRWARLATRARTSRMATWDRAVAQTADLFLVKSPAMRTEVERAYGIEAQVLPPPAGIDAEGPRVPVPGIKPGYVLCVEPLQSHRNVDFIVDAMRMLPDATLVIAGTGPLRSRFDDFAGRNVIFVGETAEWHLRWLYANAVVVVGASFDDFNAAPVEAAAHGVPFVAPRRGTYLDTVRHGVTGLLFDVVDDRSIAGALIAALGCRWDPNTLRRHAERFGEQQFITSLRAIVNAETAPVQQELPLLSIAS
jgi:glycosyltransferase involved in cell wall biosynthesis